MKGAKDIFIVNDFSRYTIKSLEEIDKETIDDEEQAVPEFGISSKCMYLMSFGPLICVNYQDNRLQILNCTQESIFRSC